jgi:hypothetical protein
MVYNSAALVPLIIGLITSSVSGRVTLVWARGGNFKQIDDQRHIIWSIIGALAFPAQLALIFVAFFVLFWPVAIATVLVLLVLPAMAVTRNSLVSFTSIQPLSNLVTVLAAISALWLVLR